MKRLNSLVVLTSHDERTFPYRANQPTSADLAALGAYISAMAVTSPIGLRPSITIGVFTINIEYAYDAVDADKKEGGE